MENNGTEIIKKGLACLEDKDYDNAITTFTSARKDFKDNPQYLSVSMSFLGMALYLKDKNNYTNVLDMLNDAQYMAEFAKNSTAKIANEYAKVLLILVKILKILHYCILKVLKIFLWLQVTNCQ